VIVREDLLRFENCPLKGPLMMDYKTLSDNGSMYNTPPCFSIYVSGLVFKHLLDLGVDIVEGLNLEKSRFLYQSIETMKDQYKCPVDERFRSRMNIVFRVLKNGVPDESAEKRFCKGVIILT
jgi:phosphoserine aminotransferase